MANTCTALTKSGNPCTMPAMRGGDLCWNHADDPEIAERRAEARSAGGHARPTISNVERVEVTINGRVLDLDTPEGIRDLLKLIVADALELNNGLQRCRLLGQLAMDLLEAYDRVEVAQRIEELEDALARVRAGQEVRDAA